MFGRKEKPKRQNRPAGSLAQYGIFEVPDAFDNIEASFAGDDDNDDDLEAELAALTSGDDPAKKVRRKAPNRPVPKENLNAMIAEGMKDINLDDEEISDGDDDPELLNELNMITGDDASPTEPPVEETNSGSHEEPNMDTIKLLEERLALYQTAEAKAMKQNENSRARRYNRGVKILQELLGHAREGKSINEADIPPTLPPSATAEVVEKPPEPESKEEEIPPSAVPESVPVSTVNQDMIELLKSRQAEYKVAALASKKSGNMKEAIQFMNIYKQFEKAIEAAAEGAVIDPTEIPPPPAALVLASDSTAPAAPPKEEVNTQQSGLTDSLPAASVQHTGPEDIGSALKERLEIYRRSKTAAESEGNSSKARRYGRICKQFEDAIKQHSRGKPVPLADLPTPPGFPPLISEQPPPPVPDVTKEEPLSELPEETTKPESETQESTISPRVPPRVPPRAQTGMKRANQKITSRAEKQMLMLQQRAHELKQAALAAKKDGDMELARDYLRQAKGIEPLIEASKSGLPVDMNSIPLSPLARIELNAHGITPKEEDSFTLVHSEDCIEDVSGTDEQIYENLESLLLKQVKWCLSTRDHCKALGDVPGYNRWERLALGYTRDLDMLRVRKRDSLPPPQHHYETKTYAIVQSCTDLSDADVEISIIRGVNYTKEADTYVMWEFPYPTDSPPADRTYTIKGSSNPEYQAVFPLNGIIDRSSRQCQRAFKRHALKCQVWAKGGFLRSDSLLGTVTVKLQPLETQCVLHDSFPLMDGRKPTGGKLELKIRLRNPILTKLIEQITDKWLIIDQ